MIKKYPCPVCGYIMFSEKPGSYEICEICYWEDDVAQLRFPKLAGGANEVSLVEAQLSFKKFGAIEQRFLNQVRKPLKDDAKDPEWRPLDVDTDKTEEYETGMDYGQTYPEDATQLYYWRN